MAQVIPLPPVDAQRLPAAVPHLDGPQTDLVASTSDLHPAKTVAFGRVTFAITLVGIFSLRGICVAYYVLAGRVYAELPTTDAGLSFQLFQLVLDLSWFPVIAAVHYALASIHAYFLIEPVICATTRRLLTTSTGMRVTQSIEVLTKNLGSRTLGSSSRPLQGNSTLRNSHVQTLRFVRRTYRKLFAHDGLFGIDSAHFDLLFLAREVVETVLQTYQAYTMTRLLPREELNGFYTLLLVINCWTTPLLKRVCRGNKSLERLLAVLCDIVLDFLSSIGVPVVVAIGYLQQYDPVAKDFVPLDVIYFDDVWLLNFLNETPIVLLGSWFDAASRLVFSLGLLSALYDVKALVTRYPRIHQAKVIKPTVLRRNSTRIKSRTASMAQKLKEPILQARVSTWVHRLMILWGIGIAIMYLEASVRAPPLHCSLPLRPWLVADPACAMVTIDCLKYPNLSGDAADFDAVYSNLDAGSVEYVIFRHCPKVEFTPRFLTFYNLYGVKTYNSTIQSWKLDAAVTGTSHPRMRFASLLLTQFPDATLPLGLQHEQFPQTLVDIEISVSNLERIPPTLPWPPYMTICVEFSQLKEFPMVFAQLEAFTVSLAFNKITSVPAAALMAPGIALLNFRGNPIHALPEFDVDITRDTPSGIYLYWLSLEYTNLTTLPSWVTLPLVDLLQIRAAQSPICLQTLQNTSSPEREISLRERPWLVNVEVLCEEDPGVHGWYPLEVDMGCVTTPEYQNLLRQDAFFATVCEAGDLCVACA